MWYAGYGGVRPMKSNRSKKTFINLVYLESLIWYKRFVGVRPLKFSS